MKTVYRSWSFRLLIIAALTALFALFVVAPAQAADTRGGDTVVIGRSEVIDNDLYVAGSTVVIDGVVKGDLVAVASQITINGTVGGDVLAAGQGVVINGTVGDDVRVAGQAVMLGPGARVGGDLAVGALSLENQSGSLVQGDLLVGSYQALLSGTIGKNVTGGLDRMELRGSVGGNVDVTVSSDQNPSTIQFSPAGQVPMPTVRPNLTVADSASIGGKLIYRSSVQGTVNPAAQVNGGVAFQPQAPARTPAPIIPGLSYVQRLFGLLLIGLLLVWLMPGWVRKMADSVETRPLPSFGWGVVAFFAFLAAVIAILVIAILLAIVFGFLTLGGLATMIVFVGIVSDAALVLSYIAFAAYVAAALIGFMVGRWVLRRVQPAWAEQPIIPMIVGLVLVILLSAIPWLGGLVDLLVVLLALGALWQWGRAMFVHTRPTPAMIGGLQPA